MSFRGRILLGSVLLVWVPFLLLAWTIRGEMSRRLTEEHGRRSETLLNVLENELESEARGIGERLVGLRREILDDNRFRLAMKTRGSDRTYVLDYAGRAMGLLGLSMLEILDAKGEIVSSGHFRNEYGRTEPFMESARATHAPYLILPARTPEGGMLTACRVDSLQLGGQWFFLIGGTRVERDFLRSVTPENGMVVSLLHPSGVISSAERLESRFSQLATGSWEWKPVFPESQWLTRVTPLPYLTESGSQESAILLASYSLAPLTQLLRNLDLWLAGVFLATVVGTLALSLWVASRISRPLVDLADQTARIDLDTLDVSFETGRSDEIGDLSRFLNSMTRRLAQSARKLRDAERQAALGEIARQVNHDVRNGLTPIRNVLRHIKDVSETEPDSLPRVFGERQGVLDSSMEYLENLASNYARLYTEQPRIAVDVAEIVRSIAAARGGGPRVNYRAEIHASNPRVLSDPVGVRRVVDNLVSNAEDSFGEAGGAVVLGLRDGQDDEGQPILILTVGDNGPGIPEDIKVRIFDDFFTTRTDGAGLGLSIVRRVVADAGGTLRMESEVGRGTQFIVEWPVANGDSGARETAEGETG